MVKPTVAKVLEENRKEHSPEAKTGWIQPDLTTGFVKLSSEKFEASPGFLPTAIKRKRKRKSLNLSDKHTKARR